MSYGLKKKKIMDKKACLSCLKIGHMAKACKSYTRCLVCQKRHVSLMCPDLDVNKKAADDVKPSSTNTEQTAVVNSHLNCTNEVLLQHSAVPSEVVANRKKCECYWTQDLRSLISWRRQQSSWDYILVERSDYVTSCLVG